MDVKFINIQANPSGLHKNTKKTGGDNNNINKLSKDHITKQSVPSYDTYVRTTPRSPERMAQIAKRKKSAQRQRIAAGLSAFGLMIGVLTGIGCAGGVKTMPLTL